MAPPPLSARCASMGGGPILLPLLLALLAACCAPRCVVASFQVNSHVIYDLPASLRVDYYIDGPAPSPADYSPPPVLPATPPALTNWEIVSQQSVNSATGDTGDAIFTVKCKAPGVPADGAPATISVSCRYVPSASSSIGCTPDPWAKVTVTYVNTITGFTDSIDYILEGGATTVAASFSLQAYLYAGSGAGDPHLVGFRGHRYEFCEKDDGANCKGHAFALVSERSHQLNTLVNRHAGPDAWPHAGAWMTAFGFRFGTTLTIELGLRTDVPYSVVPDPSRGADATRAAPVAGGFRELLSFARVNGKDVMGSTVWLESGRTMELPGGASVHFPSDKHPHDPTSGPVVVIVTPSLKVTMLIEAGDVWHLDFQVSLLANGMLMHGLLGQSLHWDPAVAEASVAGHELEYILKDGLLGHDFAFNMFAPRTGAGQGVATAVRRLLLVGRPQQAAYALLLSAGLSAGSA